MKNYILIALLMNCLTILADKTSDLANKIAVEGTHDDSQERTALRKLTHTVMQNKDEAGRKKHVISLISVLESKKETEVKAFLIREIQFTGKEEAVLPLAKYLTDKNLCSFATRTLIGIYQHTQADSIKKIIGEAFVKSSGENQSTLVKACGAIRVNTPQVITKLKSMLNDKEWSVQLSALEAIASIGEKSCADVLQSMINKNKGTRFSFCHKLNSLYIRRLAEKEKTAAIAICKHEISSLITQKNPPPFLVNYLITLLELEGEEAIDEVIKYINFPHRRISHPITRVFLDMKSEKVKVKLLKLLESGTPQEKVNALSILLVNSPEASIPFITKFLSSDNDVLKKAALAACYQIEVSKAAPFLIKALLSGNESDKKLARTTFSQLHIDKKTTTKICAAYSKETSAANKMAIIELLAVNNTKGATVTILNAAKDQNDDLRKMALKALKTTTQVSDAKLLLSFLASADSNEIRYVQNGLINAFRGENLAPEIALLIESAGKLVGKHQATVFNTLAAIDSKVAINSLFPYALSSDDEIQKSAIKALSGSPSIRAADILATACGKGSSTNRTLAARGVLQLVSSISEENLLKKRALQKALSNVKSSLEKQRIQKALSGIHAINNLALGKIVTTTGRGSKMELITDGDLNKKATAGISGKNTSFQLDLGRAVAICALGITFSYDGKSSYVYDVEASSDGQKWQKVATMKTSAKATEAGFTHYFTPLDARYFRISNINCMRGKKVNKSIKVIELAVYPEGEAPLKSNKK